VDEICAYGTAVLAGPVSEGAHYTASQLGYGGCPHSSAETPDNADSQQPYGAGLKGRVGLSDSRSTSWARNGCGG